MNSFFPTNFKSAEERKLQDAVASGYFSPKSLPDGGSVDARLCGTASSGHVVAGYKYYTTEGKPRRFALYPNDYENDIGLNFDKTGKAKPFYFMACLAFIANHPRPVILDIEQQKLIEDLEQILNRDDYCVEPGKIANFFITIFKTEKNKKTVYSALPTLKALPKDHPAYAAWDKASNSIWLPALLEGGDPYAGAPAGTPPPVAAIPLTTRDELGADHETEPAPVGGTTSW